MPNDNTNVKNNGAIGENDNVTHTDKISEENRDFVNESFLGGEDFSEKGENLQKDRPLVVEKESIHVETEQSESKDKNASTTVFTLPKDQNEQISHNELSLSELQDSAKSYFDATHTQSIDEKVSELCKLADGGFENETPLEQNSAKNSKPATKRKKIKQIISNDDMQILAQEFANANTSVNEGLTEEVAQTSNENDYSDEALIKVLGNVSEVEEIDRKYEELLSDDEPEVEYTSPAQETSILKGLRRNAIKTLVCLFGTLILTALCIFFETTASSTVSRPEFLIPGKYSAVFAYCMIQIMFFAVMFNLDGMKRGFKGFKKNARCAETLSVVTVMVCTIQAFSGALLASNDPAIRTYCSVGCLSLVLLSLNSFIKAYTTLTSFCIAASQMPKHATQQLDYASLEAQAFSKYLESDTTIFSVGRSSFISGFFKKTFAPAKVQKNSLVTVIVALIAGIASGIAAGVLKSDVYTGINAGTFVILCTLPANMLIGCAFPHLVASLKCAKTKTAIIGEGACDTYTQTGIISFDDTEVFPPKNVKVSSIRTYGQTRIDKVIIYMARIFDKVGGPLSYVFANSVQDDIEQMQVNVVEHVPDGLRLSIDETQIYVGTSNFMKLYDITTVADTMDETFLQSLGSILYMAIDGEIAAKFYIKYAINPNFEDILRSFYDAGVCVGINSLDPCINNELVTGNLKGTNYPISVIKKVDMPETMTQVSQESSSSIISLNGLHSFLKGFITLDNLRSCYRSNSLISKFCLIIGLVLSVVIALFGTSPVTTTAFILVFQLLWCVPTLLFSLFNK